MQLEEKIKNLPDSAGVYQYFDTNGRLLYIGKAKSLKKRVKSYFGFSPSLRPNPKLSVRITKMVEQTVSMDYIVVNSEHDALILENSLIKQLHPKYNILLRDDKTYPYIYRDDSQKFPRYEITRKVIQSSDITYFGPYSVAARDILDSLYELCKLVQKKSCLASKKLCLYYQIDKCLGPCEITGLETAYKKELERAQDLITNKPSLIKALKEKMEFYSEELRFEEALQIRDRIERIERSQIKSEIDFASKENYDIFVVQNSESRAVVVRMFMRDGRIISSSHDFIQLNEGYDEDEFYRRVLLDFYSNEKPPIIAPILVMKKFDTLEVIEEHLTQLFEKKAQIIIPQKGDKKKIVELALLNATELLKKDIKGENTKLSKDIQELFALQRVPSRVEVFDNSHISGVATVGAMIVYVQGAFDKKSYRTYHLQARDEYAQMRETLTRRVASFSKNSPPDLWIIDGGETLLKLALDIVESSGTQLDVIAISKEKIDAKTHRAKGKANDIVHTKEQSFSLLSSDKRLQWIQNLRDEAHRAAISFHKKTKLKQDQESKLLSLHGISQAKIVKLLKHFGTFEALRKINEDAIGEILNKNDAKTIKNIYK